MRQEQTPGAENAHLPHSSKLAAWAAGAGVALFSFVLYLRTLAPSVLYYDRPIAFDSAMLQAEAAVLGIGHPTGYPTYMMLTHLFTRLPGVEPAYGANLASAVYAALAVAVLFAVALRLSGRVVAAAAGSLAFAVSGTLWSQAVIPEVYALNVLFVALTVFALLIWRDTRRDRYLLLAAFLAGLSLTHHLTSGLLIPAGLFFVLATERRRLLDMRLLLQGIGLFLLGLLPLLYLPVRASMGAPLDETHPTTLGRFLLLVTGWSYAIATPEEKARCAVSPLVSEGFGDRMQLFAGHLFGEFSVILMLVGAFGMLCLIRADRPAAAVLGTLFIGCLAHVLFYLERGIEDFAVFLIPVYAVFGVCISIGIGFLQYWTERLAANRPAFEKA
ncbi:MAG: protein O-mannosyl-transferase family, partial [Rubrobacteraceae bacterium]